MLPSKMLKAKINIDNEVFEEELFAAILELKYKKTEKYLEDGWVLSEA